MSEPSAQAKVIAAGFRVIEGKVLLAELWVEGDRYWLEFPDGQQRQLGRDAARLAFELLGDPNPRETP